VWQKLIGSRGTASEYIKKYSRSDVERLPSQLKSAYRCTRDHSRRDRPQIDVLWDMYRILVKEVLNTSSKVVKLGQALCTEESLGNEKVVCNAAGHYKRHKGGIGQFPLVKGELARVVLILGHEV